VLEYTDLISRDVEDSKGTYVVVVVDVDADEVEAAG
jgi:sporulation protein YlmC with PRC-barrel domain